MGRPGRPQMQVLRDGVSVDVLFVDVRMPGRINGFGLAS